MNYSRNARYFRPAPSPKSGIIFIVIGILLLGIGAANSIGAPIAIGVVLIALGGLILYFKYSNIPSDQEIDRLAGELAKDIKSSALKKLGLEEEEISMAEPIMFYGWGFFEDGRRPLHDESLGRAWDVQRNGVWRAPVVELHFFGFSENMIHYYCKCISLVSSTYREDTDEYFYKDIVSVKTGTADFACYDFAKNKEDPSRHVIADTFRLTSTGGTSISCKVHNHSQAEQSVNAMRNLLKQKKLES